MTYKREWFEFMGYTPHKGQSMLHFPKKKREGDMSEEQVQESVQENLDIKVESKPETADSGLLQEVMSKKATIKELQAKLDEHNTANEKARQKQLSEDGKKDELIAELNSKVDKLEGEYTRLSKYYPSFFSLFFHPY